MISFLLRKQGVIRYRETESRERGDTCQISGRENGQVAKQSTALLLDSKHIYLYVFASFSLSCTSHSSSSNDTILLTYIFHNFK